MSLLFQDLTQGMVKKSLEQLHEQLFSARDSAFEEYQNWYMGGANVFDKLIRHKGEDDVEWKERSSRACNPNFLALLADKLIDGAYGSPVMRSLGKDADEKQEETFQDILTWNIMVNIQRQIAQSVVVLGDGWLNVAFKEPDKVSLFPVHPSNVWYATDPDNANRVVEVVERREDQRKQARSGEKPPYIYWIWNEAQASLVDQDGLPIEIIDSAGRSWPNPYNHGYGRVPYVHFIGRPVIGSTDGLSYIRNLVPIQKLLYNRASDLDVTIIYQAHGVLVIQGYKKAEVESGPKRFIGIEGPDSSASFISPDAPIDMVQISIDKLVEWMFQTGNVPVSLVNGATANSGLQLAIEMRPFVQVVETIRAHAIVSEMDMVRCICSVGNAYDMGMPDPDSLRPTIEFPDNIIPQDMDAAFRRDILMVNNIPQLMTRADFLLKWIDKVNTAEEAAAYEALLNKESVSSVGVGGSSSDTTPATVPPTPPPPVPPDGGEGGKPVPVTPGGGGGDA